MRWGRVGRWSNFFLASGRSKEEGEMEMEAEVRGWGKRRRLVEGQEVGGGCCSGGEE